MACTGLEDFQVDKVVTLCMFMQRSGANASTQYLGVLRSVYKRQPAREIELSGSFDDVAAEARGEASLAAAMAAASSFTLAKQLDMECTALNAASLAILARCAALAAAACAGGLMALNPESLRPLLPSSTSSKAAGWNC